MDSIPNLYLIVFSPYGVCIFSKSDETVCVLYIYIHVFINIYMFINVVQLISTNTFSHNTFCHNKKSSSIPINSQVVENRDKFYINFYERVQISGKCRRNSLWVIGRQVLVQNLFVLDVLGLSCAKKSSYFDERVVT